MSRGLARRFRRRGGRRLSLRARLLAITLAMLVTGLLISSAVAVGTLRSHLIERVDDQLRPLAYAAARISPDILRPITSGEARRAVHALTGGLDLVSEAHVAYLTPDGRIDRLGRPGAPGPALPRLDTAAVAALRGEPFEVPGAGGEGRWRAIALPRADRPLGPAATPPVPGSGVVVAVSMAGVNSTVARLTLVCVLTGAALLALLAVAGRFAVRAGLRPLHDIEETAAAIAGGDLTRRVPESAPPSTEIGRLSAALNGMLGQIEAAFAAREESEARMRRFVADVSHELRTPLFGIKGFSELYAMGGLSGEGDVDRTMARIRSESARLAGLVEDLLLLARLDEGEAALPMDLAPMDLRTLAADARHDLRALDPSRPVELTGPDGGDPGRAPVLGDEARLRQVVANLVGNAVAHTPPGTPVRVGVGTCGGEAVLVVQDRGPGLTAEQAARVFDRFYRVDASRGRSAGPQDATGGGHGGAGLGLAIVRSIVTAHGGRVTLRTAPGEGAAFRIALPRGTS
ncbi:two-component system OmpR family sensor kinase [Thermocatellispora tengchongensis]|uniref:histidine kinase n=1 Tax=Thermocatellispora tengchongensis TaxID=1073253 RepID=A0A840P2B4_9ACTN|nr:HAMP domain-containing sensor histidine kinase [Thermocatellispora tengchongensis]MBB5132073.1 two-component system OmpR family sensor kinase [Thermocatellispora tengchongensis]